MYKAIINRSLCHANYTIDDDGRFHSTADGKFVSKGGRVSADQLSTDELKRVNTRDRLEDMYNKNHKTNAGRVAEGLDSASRGLSNAANATRNIRLKQKKNPRIDLSKYSDKELDAILRREEMEQRYDRYFNSPQENKGQKFVDGLTTALAIAGGVAGIAVAGVTIYDKLANK